MQDEGKACGDSRRDVTRLEDGPSGPRSQRKLHHGNISEHRTWAPTQLFPQLRQIFSIRPKSHNQIPNESRSKHASNLSAVSDPVWRLMRFKELSCAQGTTNPSPARSQHGEMFHVFHKSHRASGSPRKRISKNPDQDFHN